MSALYRYPVKGFTPEARDELRVEPGGRIRGDRVLAFRFAEAVDPEEDDGLDHWPKDRGLALMRFATLARLHVEFSDDDLRLRIREGDRLLVDVSLDGEGRAEAEAAVTEYVSHSSDARLLDAAGVRPLKLIGDGRTSRFQDRAQGFVSLHGAASVAAVDAVDPAPIDDRRFRSNIVIEGTAAWEELGWSGVLRIGDVEFEIREPIGRCAAITVNPDTGIRDARLMRVLTTEFGQAEPTLGILLLPTGGGGTIRVGDEVTVVDAT